MLACTGGFFVLILHLQSPFFHHKRMTLKSLNILNYKNLAECRLDFAPTVNCLIGDNGMGKTNVLDAIYCLSYCRSFTSRAGESLLRYGEESLLLQGVYDRHGKEEDISLSMGRGRRKVVRRGGKEYQRLSMHIGLLPLVMVSPLDGDLVSGAGDERRRFMDMIISQGDNEYLSSLIAYNKALEQRNSMIRREMRDPLLFETVEHVLAVNAAVLHERRQQWMEQFKPIFLKYYDAIARGADSVDIAYRSQLDNDGMQQLLDASRERDAVMGYTTRGAHRDDMAMTLNNHAMRHSASQGQRKTFTIALRLAQFEFLRRQTSVTPLLLLDDIFDKLDAKRVESIVTVVASSEQFGQIFITDTNRTHIDSIIARLDGEHAMFEVRDGQVGPIAAQQTEIT